MDVAVAPFFGRRTLFFAGSGFVFRFFLFKAGFILAHKGAKLWVIVFLAVEGIIQRAFRMLFRHGQYSL
jgi:hypothetical protein